MLLCLSVLSSTKENASTCTASADLKKPGHCLKNCLLQASKMR